MKNFEKNIDKMISNILKEEIESRSKTLLERIEEGGEWTEIEVDEELHGGQKKIDMNKNGKIDAEDFKMLRKKKSHKKEVDEFYFYDDESTPGDYEGDEGAEEKAEELSAQEPTYVGKGLADNKIGADIKNKIFGSFSDEHGWYNERDEDFEGEFDFDYDEEEFDDFQSMYDKYGKQTKWFSPGERGQRLFDMYKEKYGPMKIRVMKMTEEDGETEEGNAFTGALAKAKESGEDSFEVDGKKFDVKETKNVKCPKCGMKNCKCNHKKESKEGRDEFDGRKSKVIGVYSNIKNQRKEMGEKWEGDVDVKQTGEYSDMSIAQLNAHIKKLKAQNEKKKDAGDKVPEKDRTKMSQLYFAKRAKQGWKGKGKAAVKESLQLTEDELIDMIEKIVMEQKKVKDKAEKDNIGNKKPEGLKKTEKVLKADKKENDDYAKQVVKKMKEYVKAGSVGEFNESPENFPESNYSLGKMKEKTMKYHPSQAVDEYIEAFAFPGMTNLVYDEIKPDEKKIEKHLKGDSTMGNAVKDKDGKALGNVVPSEVGERFMKNFEDNLYGAEQMNVSYKRQPQPVDVNGTDKMTGSLKSIRKGSTDKANKIMNQLESAEEKDGTLIKEDMQKMMKLMSYNKKTQ